MGEGTQTVSSNHCLTSLRHSSSLFRTTGDMYVQFIQRVSYFVIKCAIILRLLSIIRDFSEVVNSRILKASLLLNVIFIILSFLTMQWNINICIGIA